MENEPYTMDEDDSIYNQFFAGKDEYKHVIKNDHGPDGDTNIYLKNGKHVAYEEFIEKKVENDKVKLKAKKSREELAYEKFVDSCLKFLKLDSPETTEADIEQMREEMLADEQVRAMMTQALNEFLWEQDENVTASIRETYTNLQDLIKKTIPEEERGEETGKILQVIDELVEAEDTEEELLSADDLMELTKDEIQDDNNKPITL